MIFKEFGKDFLMYSAATSITCIAASCGNVHPAIVGGIAVLSIASASMSAFCAMLVIGISIGVDVAENEDPPKPDQEESL